jgi:hypothetical protein
MPYTKTSRQIPCLSEPVRLAFPELLEPKIPVINGRPAGDPKFSARIVISKSQTGLIQEIDTILREILAAAWPEGAGNQLHWPLVDADQAYPDDANIAGCMVINASANQNSPPQLMKFGANGVQVALNSQADRAMIYSGMEVWASIGFFSYNTSAQSYGIGCGLNALLLTGVDRGRFDSRINAATAFANVKAPMPQPPAGMAGAAPPPPQQQGGYAPPPQGGYAPPPATGTAAPPPPPPVTTGAHPPQNPAAPAAPWDQ